MLHSQHSSWVRFSRIDHHCHDRDDDSVLPLKVIRERFCSRERGGENVAQHHFWASRSRTLRAKRLAARLKGTSRQGRLASFLQAVWDWCGEWLPAVVVLGIATALFAHIRRPSLHVSALLLHAFEPCSWRSHNRAATLAVLSADVVAL